MTLTDRIRGVDTSVAIKVPVRCCTTENITLSGLQTIDGVSLAAGDRVLVRNQTDAVTNGIWTASIGAWARTIDFNGTYDAVLGTEVYVQSGTVNADLRFALTTAAPVIGTSELAFTAISGTVTLLAEEARDAAIAAAASAAGNSGAAAASAVEAQGAADAAAASANEAEALIGAFNPDAVAEAAASAVAAAASASTASTAAATAIGAADEAEAARDVAVGIADTLPNWRGAWVTATAYGEGDLIQSGGSSYICVTGHTSAASFATDLGAGRWELFAAKGAAGAGTGDMVGANNLSDVADAAASRTNLGLGSMATQGAGAVNITGGTIAGITDLAVADGGTGASTADGALTNLGATAAGKALFTAADAAAQAALLGVGAVTGAISAFAMNTAPGGWLKANGAAVSRTTYADLFAAIGTTFGSGDGSTTFTLPDLRGEFIRGWSDGRSVDTGRVFGSAQSDDNKSHTHTGSAASSGAHTHKVAVADSSGTSTSRAQGGATTTAREIDTQSSGAHTHTLTIDSSGGAEARPRNIALLYCIKF